MRTKASELLQWSLGHFRERRQYFLNRRVHSVSRHESIQSFLKSPPNLRLGALVLLFIAISQVNDPLIDPTLGQEILYWLLRISVLAAGLWVADTLVSRLLADRWPNPVWLKPVVLVSVIGLLPFAVVEILIEPHLPMRPEFVDDDLWAYSPLLALLSEYATVLSILVPMHLLLWLIIDRQQAEPSIVATEAEPQSISQPEFLARATVQRVEDVLALQAEEHYVRIFTQDGAELIHHRFGDAVEAMPAELGMQVHRSWWVAETAIRSANRDARRWKLQLVSDVTVPVSDSFLASVRERGWLKRV